MSGQLTATRENALAPEELVEFLTRAHGSGRRIPIARLATIRPDGFPHVTPTWYIWEDERFFISLGAPRRHVYNLRKNNKVGLIIDEDFRPERGPEVGAKAVCVRGTATLSTDSKLIRSITGKELGKMLGEEMKHAFLEPAIQEGRVIVTVEPIHMVTWDFAKASS